MFENRPDACFLMCAGIVMILSGVCLTVALSLCIIYLKFSTPCSLRVNHIFYSN
jgi:hypothetical protein